MEWLTVWADAWNSRIGLADFLLGIIGFTITIWSVLRSKRAAEGAERAAKNARDALVNAATIADFATAMSIMEEIKRLHRVAAWTVLPDRYSVLRRTLISIRSSMPALSDEQATAFQGAIQHFSSIEQKVERSLHSGKPLPDAARLNKLVSEQIDSLGEIVNTLRLTMGRTTDG